MKKMNKVMKWILILIAIFVIWALVVKIGLGNDSESNGIFKGDSSRGEPEICTQDALKCDDGSFVERDPYNNCLFFECPGGN